MKLVIDLDETVADYEWDRRVGEIIREEIDSAIRSAVRAEIKEFNKQIKAEVQEIAKDALASVKRERVQDIARRMAGEL